MSRRAASGMAARIGVSMIPGETALTRTGASSSARLRASDSIAPLAAPTIAAFGRGRILK
jgi:small neutral amino acid transporter SnatA (MarC family)